MDESFFFADGGMRIKNQDQIQLARSRTYICKIPTRKYAVWGTRHLFMI